MKKNFLLILLFLVATIVSFGQTKNPTKEFNIRLSTTSLDLRPGQSSDVSVFISRSKGYSKSEAVLGTSSDLPDGISVVFETDDGSGEQYLATIALSETVRPGEYRIVLKSTIQRKTKGVVLKLNVQPQLNNKSVTSGYN